MKQAFHALVLFIAATGLLILLYQTADRGPLSAAREALLSAYLEDRAYRDVPQDLRTSVKLVAFDRTYCNDGQADREGVCQPDGPIERRAIANIVRLAAIAKPRAILVDFLPRSREGPCDAGTRALVHALLDASEVTPVILPRSSLGSEVMKQEGEQVFDQCREALTNQDSASLARGDRVFFGHVFLSATRPHGPVDSIRPWIVSHIWRGEPGNPPTGAVRSRIPAVSLLAAVAVTAESPEMMFTQLQTGGLETRWRSDQALTSPPKRVLYCDEDLFESCVIQVPSDITPAEPWRLSFRFGRQPVSAINMTDVAREERLSVVSASFFDEERAQQLASTHTENPFIIVIGATAPEYGDFHRSLIGDLPGSLVHSNAFFDFLGNGFILTPDSRHALRADLIALALFSGTAMGLALAIVVVFGLTPRARPIWHMPSKAKQKWAWPIALLLVSIWKANAVWSSLHGDFDEGVFSYAMLGGILAVVHLYVAFESGLETLARNRALRSEPTDVSAGLGSSPETGQDQ